MDYQRTRNFRPHYDFVSGNQDHLFDFCRSTRSDLSKKNGRRSRPSVIELIEEFKEHTSCTITPTTTANHLCICNTSNNSPWLIIKTCLFGWKEPYFGNAYYWELKTPGGVPWWENTTTNWWNSWVRHMRDLLAIAFRKPERRLPRMMPTTLLMIRLYWYLFSSLTHCLLRGGKTPLWIQSPDRRGGYTFWTQVPWAAERHIFEHSLLRARDVSLWIQPMSQRYKAGIPKPLFFDS